MNLEIRNQFDEIRKQEILRTLACRICEEKKLIIGIREQKIKSNILKIKPIKRERIQMQNL